jgi:hypothetical protein
MPTEIRASQYKTQRLEIPAKRLNWTRPAASRSTFAVPLTLLAWVHSKSLKHPRRTPPKVVFRKSRRILRRELSTLAARRFSRHKFGRNRVDLIRTCYRHCTELLLRRVSCAGNGLMGGVNE